MQAYIKGICVFNEKGERREIELAPGLNIISGESQTGKSALLEIIDYCLGNSTFTIPEGIITDFAKLYAIILCFGNNNILLARRDKSQTSKMFLKNISPDLTIKQVSLDLFEEILFRPRPEILQKIAKQFGINVTDTTEDADADTKGAKGSIRNLVPFLFQHQNLIASKFALFYRFDDPYKKRATIKQFPVFAGWVDQTYYTTQLKIDQVKKEIEKQEKSIELTKKLNVGLEQNLRAAFLIYYNLIGRQYNPQWELSQLEEEINLFPSFKTPLNIQEPVYEQYENLKRERSRILKEDSQLRLKISKLKESEQIGNEYSQILTSLNVLGKGKATLNTYDCPLCGVHNEVLSEEAIKLVEAQDWLGHELQLIPKQTKNFSVEILKLETARKKLRDELEVAQKGIDRIEEISRQIKEGALLEDQKLDAQKTVEVEFRFLRDKHKQIDEKELLSLKDEYLALEEILSSFDLRTKYQETESFIRDRMNTIVKKLNFEFTPPQLRFPLEQDSQETFSLYHIDSIRNKKIFLGQMGSGSNWLACHLGLFLSFLHYFSVTETSKVPSFLFLDQPSQVYFPKGT